MRALGALVLLFLSVTGTLFCGALVVLLLLAAIDVREPVTAVFSILGGFSPHPISEDLLPRHRCVIMAMTGVLGFHRCGG